jgi:transposase
METPKLINPNNWLIMRNLKQQGLSNTKIAEYLNVDRKTVYNNLKKEHTPVYKRNKLPESKLAPYEDYINKRLKKYNLTAKRILKEITSQGYTGSYSVLSEFVSSQKKIIRNSAVLRFETMPGEQSQVDWGYMGQIYDVELSKTINVYCFVMILGYSRTRFIKFYSDAKLPNFLDGHNSAIEYYGGYTREMLYDNLKSVVIKRALKSKDSDFNAKFMDFSGYYGFKVVLCRPYKPCTKGKVEKTVNFVKQSFYEGRDFSSLTEINNNAVKWLNEVNDTVHATTHEKPFDRLTKEHLITLENKELYSLKEVQYRKVNNDCHFSFNTNKYSVPYKYAGKEISIMVTDDNRLEISYRGHVIAEHSINFDDSYEYITIDKHLEGLKEIRIKSGIKNHYRKIKKDPDKKLLLKFTPSLTDEKVENRSLSTYDEVVS